MNIGQEDLTLRSGSKICNELIDVEARSLTPETCSIGEFAPTRTRYRWTEHSVRFDAPGRCEIELTWPGTEVKQRHTFAVVEPPDR